MPWVWLLAAVLAIACAPKPGAGEAQAPDTQPGAQPGEARPIPADLVGQVEQAKAVGGRLFILDSSTAVAWDTLEAKLGSLEQAGLGHFLAVLGADEQGAFDNTVHVLFFTAESPPRQAYDVVVSMEPRGIRIDPIEPPSEASSEVQAVLRARQTALGAVQSAQPLNPVVLPGPAGSIVVYLLAATTQPDVAVLGRHYRVVVSASGDRIISVTPLSKAALELSTKGPDGSRAVALSVTHILSDTPTETHVLASRMAELPIFVATRRGLWLVNAYDISYHGPLPE